MAKIDGVQEVSLELLKPYENNAKIHSETQVKQIADSISEFGFLNPCLIDKDFNIIAGHGRVMAAKKLGMETVPCIFVEGLTEAQRRAYILADNRLTELGEWDFDKVQLELKELADMNFDVELTGFELEDYGEPKEIIEDDFSEDVEPITKLGDIWQLGRHRLICGDSTDPNVIEKLMDGEKADMVFTDPPYGMGLDTDFSSMKNHLDFAKEKGFIGGKKYSQGKVDEFNPNMIEAVFAIGADEMFLWGADYYSELLQNKNEGSWLVWDKRANGNNDEEEDYSSDKMYGSCFELCWSKKKHKRDIARIKWAGVFGTEQEFDHKRYHPTQKPIKLSEWFIKRYSKNEQTIVDLFGGSGSTLIACEQLNRTCFMSELDPHYCDVIINRWETLTGEKAVRL